MTRLPAVPVFLGRSSSDRLAFMLTFTLTNIYYVTEVGMSPLELVLCGTAMELAIFLFEVPTGVVADIVSRRLSDHRLVRGDRCSPPSSSASSRARR